MYIYTYIYICIHICIYIYECMYVHIYIYINRERERVRIQAGDNLWKVSALVYLFLNIESENHRPWSLSEFIGGKIPVSPGETPLTHP